MPTPLAAPRDLKRERRGPELPGRVIGWVLGLPPVVRSFQPVYSLRRPCWFAVPSGYVDEHRVPGGKRSFPNHAYHARQGSRRSEARGQSLHLRHHTSGLPDLALAHGRERTVALRDDLPHVRVDPRGVPAKYRV